MYCEFFLRFLVYIWIRLMFHYFWTRGEGYSKEDSEGSSSEQKWINPYLADLVGGKNTLSSFLKS